MAAPSRVDQMAHPDAACGVEAMLTEIAWR